MRVYAFCLLITATAVGALPQPDRPAQEKWGWFAAVSNTNRWSTETGIAEVSRIDGAFVARLFRGDHLRHEVRGSFKGDRVIATMTTVASELKDYPLHGAYQRKVWKDAVIEVEGVQYIGRETIELAGAGIVVGFTREIERSQVPHGGTTRESR